MTIVELELEQPPLGEPAEVWQVYLRDMLKSLANRLSTFDPVPPLPVLVVGVNDKECLIGQTTPEARVHAVREVILKIDATMAFVAYDGYLSVFDTNAPCPACGAVVDQTCDVCRGWGHAPVTTKKDAIVVATFLPRTHGLEPVSAHGSTYSLSGTGQIVWDGPMVAMDGVAGRVVTSAYNPLSTTVH